MKLGAFSTSLAVKDIAASQAFYERLGFARVFGNAAQGWIILRNGTTTIGLFQGMFDSNILTFNPGWDASNQPLADFTDIRDLQRQFTKSGMTFVTKADETTTGPASFMLADPDGNTILFDQHL